MSHVHNSVETVNAAATAIVAAESRVQPSMVQKRRWANFWSIYWCFGAHKQSKRVGHAILVSEPSAPTIVASIVENRNHTSSVFLPFIAPPSSPTSHLQSDPSSAIQSPAGGLLSLKSLSVHAPSIDGAQMFTIGPYAHETQLVSPPVFSAFTTEPSTASFTPPPEPVQMTTPLFPEVPFAQLLSSSLARSRRSNGANLKYSLSQYEFQPYQYAHFPSYKWGSRVGSGSLTPSGGGYGSRLDSGNLTPTGGLSRLGSGTLTPNAGEPPSRDSKLADNQILELALDHNPQNDDAVVDHRVSFELLGEDIPICIVMEPIPSDNYASEDQREAEEAAKGKNKMNADSCPHHCCEESVNEVHGMRSDQEAGESREKYRTISFGSSRDFNFNNAREEVEETWWTNEKTELGTPQNSWNFFPMLQSGAN